MCFIFQKRKQWQRSKLSTRRVCHHHRIFSRGRRCRDSRSTQRRSCNWQPHRWIINRWWSWRNRSDPYWWGGWPACRLLPNHWRRTTTTSLQTQIFYLEYVYFGLNDTIYSKLRLLNNHIHLFLISRQLPENRKNSKPPTNSILG